MNLITKQKYMIIFCVLSINILLSIFITIYRNYWYIFIIILGSASFINSINVILLIIHKIFKNKHLHINKGKYILDNINTNTNYYLDNLDNLDNKTNKTRKELALYLSELNIYPNTFGNNRNNRNNRDNNNNNNNRYTLSKSNIVYVIPCYNETEKELQNTIYSIYAQKNVEYHNKFLIVICDGKIPCKTGQLTSKILTETIFKNHIIESHIYNEAYSTWENKWNELEIHTGILNNIKFILIIKSRNLGKRDSLTLIRRMIYYYNNKILSIPVKPFTNNKSIKLSINEFAFINDYCNCYFSPEFIEFIETAFDKEDTSIQTNQPTQHTQPSHPSHPSHPSQPTLTPTPTPTTNHHIPIDYIIGTDADTILDNYCVTELIYGIKQADSYTIGIVGFVDIIKSWSNPLIIYQYCEYLFAQCLKRKAQSHITNKVSCLSGCVQLIKVCNETCGNDILDKFNHLPEKKDNILKHIRSYASEDRNHICLMFDMYPYVKTIQSLKAIAYTNVPDTLIKFIRQRKRWCAGATCNDLLLIFNSKHNKWERLQSLVNVTIFLLTIFVFVATIEFIIAIITHPTILMLMLALIMLLPAIYSLLIPICIYNDGTDGCEASYNYKNLKSTKISNLLYYTLGFFIYYTLGSILNLVVYFYTFCYLDDLHWNSIKISDSDSDSNSNSDRDSKDSKNSNDSNSYSDSNDSNYNNSSNIYKYLCNCTHTFNCSKWIIFYGCSCKTNDNNNDNDNDNNDNIDETDEHIYDNIENNSVINRYRLHDMWDSTIA